MKKLLFLSLMSTAILTVSCKKEKEPEPTPEQNLEVTEENVSDHWRVSGFEVDAEGEFFGNQANLKATGKDFDLDFIFDHDPNIATVEGEMTLNVELYVGGNLFDQRDEKIEYEDPEEGTWELMDSNKKIKINVTLLDNNNFVVKDIVLDVKRLTDQSMHLEGQNKVFVNALNEEVDGFIKLRLRRNTPK